MTDTDPLAPIEALADNWARGYPSLVIAPQLRAALAEARQAVDGLVAERNAARAEIQSAVLARNSAMRRQAEERLAKEGNIAALNAAVAERDGWEQRFRELQTESRALPCDGGCVEAPEEDCSRHGRTPADLWRIIDEVRAERDAAREALARVEALAKIQATRIRAMRGMTMMARNWLDVLAIIERAAIVRPATDEVEA